MLEHGPKFVNELLAAIGSRLHRTSAEATGEQEDPDPMLDIALQIEQARKDWNAAKAYFENVSDPELVDHAIHLVLATEKRYTYLIREAKETYQRVREA